MVTMLAHMIVTKGLVCSLVEATAGIGFSESYNPHMLEVVVVTIPTAPFMPGVILPLLIAVR